MIDEQTAWTIARLLAGLPAPEPLPPAAGPGAELLRAVTAAEATTRLEAFRAALATLPDAPAIERAVLAADPRTPPGTAASPEQLLSQLKALLDRGADPELKARILARIAPLLTGDGGSGHGWQIFTLADAYRERPAREYVVRGLLPVQSLAIVYGPSGCYKSMLLLDLAACVAGGLPWLDPLPGHDDARPFATIQSPVLWVDFDSGHSEMHERIEAAGRARDLPATYPLFYTSLPVPHLDAGDALGMAELSQRCQQLGARLLVIDNLGAILGKTEENSAGMAAIMANFRRLAEDSGAAVVVVHHDRKYTGLVTRSGESLRGHSSIEAGLDLALRVKRDQGTEKIDLHATKVRRAPVAPFGAVFTYEHKAGTDKELAKMRFFGRSAADTGSDHAIRGAVLEALEGSPETNKSALTEAVKGELPEAGTNRIREAIDWLTREKKIEVKTGARGAKLYSLPGQELIF